MGQPGQSTGPEPARGRGWRRPGGQRSLPSGDLGQLRRPPSSQAYVNEFKFQSILADDFLEFYLEYFPELKQKGVDSIPGERDAGLRLLHPGRPAGGAGEQTRAPGSSHRPVSTLIFLEPGLQLTPCGPQGAAAAGVQLPPAVSERREGPVLPGSGDCPIMDERPAGHSPLREAIPGSPHRGLGAAAPPTADGAACAPTCSSRFKVTSLCD